ncbi:MAG: heat shock protein HtpX [Sulfurospirillum sp.]|jgi:heat shock protein HtpX|nr:heat shock protein HtpX [Sulfurospirillum sp.]DAB34004.1 MAG TPA: protease [Sulfurospirillum sp. UBA12182]
MEQIKTVGLLTFLTVIFVFIGNYVGGQSGMLIALILAGAMNFYAYYFSDKMVLAHYKGVQVDRNSARGLYEMVERLSQRAGLPMPKVYIIPEATPNAFATGRNPQNAAVAVTEGLLNLLSDEEVEGVIAHELSHVKHYDILIGTIAATFAGAISFIANMLQFGAMFGNRERNGNPILMLIMAIVLPLAAMFIQMSVSRSREYMADEGAARLTKNPQWLQSALLKLEEYSQRMQFQEATPATAHMMIVNPFSKSNFSMSDLFRTHPSTQDRIARLESLKKEFGVSEDYRRDEQANYDTSNGYDRKYVRRV